MDTLQPTSLVDLLQERALEQALETAYTFLADGEREESRLTFAELDRRARAIATVLAERGARDERVLLLFLPGLDFIAGFFGCLYARAVAVPTYPPRMQKGNSRLDAILASARPKVVLTTSALLARREAVCQESPALAGLPWIAVDELEDAAAELWQRPSGVDGGTVAFLQYTSGSTSAPKGVIVSHGNLLANEEMIRRSCRHDAGSDFVSWLPMYHDMGLIGSVLQPLYLGSSCVLMAPVAFLQRPMRWLRAISRYRAHTSGAPNFAYDLCVRKSTPEERAGLDLSSWRIAFNGAEPVRRDTLELFTEAFAPAGFRPATFFPCYGLAEATLIVSGVRREAPPRTLTVNGRELDGHRVVEAAGEEPGARSLVSCGPTILDEEVAIVQPESRRRCAPGEVGEIWVSGDHVARGYWELPEVSEAVFGARIEEEGERTYLRTGDLGFFAAGELYVTGRIKDLVILRGVNHYPQDLELTVERQHPALRSGCAAAFAVEAGGEERLAVVQEVDVRKLGDTVDWQEVLRSILRALAEEHEVQPCAVVLTRPGVVPKTSSGKVQRFACRQMFLAGIAQTVAEVRFDLGPGSTAAEPAADLDLAGWLASRIARRLGVDPAAIRADEPLGRFGLDSLAAIELAHDLETRLGVSLSLPDLLESTLADLAGLAGLVPGAAAAEEPDPKTVMPLSRGQKALWFLSREEPESPARNIVGAARIRSGLDAGALRRAFQTLVDRHPGLRTVFAVRGGEPEPRVLESSEVDFQVRDAARLEEEAFRPFDLEAGPLLRVRLAEAGDGSGVLLVALHHVIADFWSMAVLLNELRALLSSRELPAVADGYAGWVRDQERLLAGPRGEALERYWLDRLAGAPAALDLIPDRPRRERRSGVGAARHFQVDGATTARLRELGGRSGATLFTTLLAAWQTLLLRVTGQEDVVVGAPWAGRSRAGVAGVVGYFVNPLALRSDLSGDPSFSEVLERVRGTVLGAFEHADLPFPLLVERLGPERLPGRTPFLEVTFAFQKPPSTADQALAAFALGRSGHALNLGGLVLESLDLPRRPLPFELSLLIGELDGGLAGALEYDPDLFDAATVDRLGEGLRSLLETAAADPGVRIWDLPLTAGGERLQTLAEAPLPPGPMVHERFERRAAEAPEAVALVSSAATVTYGELNRRADLLARRLRALGVAAETPVALLCDRSVEMVVGALAVLKAGGAYVPLDPATPPSRLSWLLEDTDAPVLLTRGSLAAALPPHGARTVLLEEETAADLPVFDAPPGGPGRIAYVIYTSGSTGRPKGVAVPHAGLSNLARWHEEAFAVTPADRASHLAGLGFDAAVWELWPYLSAGATVCLAPEEVRGSAEALWRWLAAEGITVAFLPTPLAEAVLALDSRPAARLRLLLAGGDRLRARPRPGEGFRLVNNYGPTESTVVTTSGEVAPAPAPGLPAIGRPIAGLRVRLFQRWSPVPVGLPGELCVAGAGLARGYLGRPELTAERFVPDPFAAEPGGRMYRTGDLCRQRPDGELEFLGRIDSQIKLRGFRIEPGEIEAALKRHPAVSEAAVAVRDGVLTTWAAAGAAAGELRRFLDAELPGHMVPAVFVVLPELPLLPSGKIDRRSLPAPGLPEEDGTPRTAAEELVAGVWAQALDLPRVGVRDDLFALGGHSLLAARIASRIGELFGVDLPVRALFEEPTVEALARRLDQARGTAPSPLRAVDRSRPLRPSFAQERLWFLEQVRPDTPLYNIPAVLALRGGLQEEALRTALAEVARRHEALRTTFAAAGGQPVLVVHPSIHASMAGLSLPVVDLSGLPDVEGEAGRLEREEARRPFDLERGPLARATLLRIAPDERRVLLTLHHIVADGWSTDVLLREVAALYRAGLENRPSPLPELRFQVADVAARQREELSSEALAEPLAWWRGRLAGMPAALDLPLDRPRPAVQGTRGATVRHTLTAGLRRELAGLGRRSGATLFMVLLAGFEALLARVSGQERMVVGSPVAGRNRPETEGLIGFFVNTLALPGDVSGDPAVETLLGRVREIALGAYSRQEVPFERLVEELRPERSLGLAPLFQVVLALQGRTAPVELPGAELEIRESDTGTAKFDLTVSFRETDEGLAGSWELALDLFDRTTVARLARQLETLLIGMTAGSGLRVSELPILSEAERHQLAAEWNDAATDFPRDRTVHGLAAEQARRTPDSRVVYGEESLAFLELDREANRLAHHLRSLGVERGAPVALFLEPSLRFVLGSLAILKAGGAYVPLDGAYPRERLAFMLADVGAPLLLTEERLLERLPACGARILCLDDRAAWAGERDDDPDAGATADDLAYVIYTSGSTGVPKGVAVPHRAIVRLVRDTNYMALGPDDVVAQVSNTSFDAATFELWGALLTGARLTGIPRDVLLSPRRFADELRATGATAMFLTSALFNQVCLEVPDAFATMPLLMVGGEALDPARIRQALAAGRPGRLLNGYGPTESTTYAAWHPVQEVAEGALSIPIGRPLANTRLHVLDRDLRPVPVGVPGELFLGGDGLARGYIRRPALTAERFVPDPLAGDRGEAGERLYRTGDLARVLPDGTVDYLGRLDGQVKLRGFRIELGEIEAALTGHPGVREAAVVVPVEGEKRLVAYVAAEEGADLAAAALREALARRLPEPMLPSALVFLDRLPLTPNGKVDRKALARLSPAAEIREEEDARPRTPVEELLAGLWAQMLGVPRVGLHDDFFELGGHSLLVTRLVSRVREVLGVELPVRQVFESPTVAGLAARIGSPASPAFADVTAGPIPRLSPDAARPLSFGQQRLWFLDQLEPGSAFYNLPAALRLRGRLELPALETALSEIVRRHEVLRTVYPAKDGKPSPVVLPFAGVALPKVDLTGVAGEGRSAELARLADEDARRPFALARGPLLRSCLVRLGEDDHALLLNLHHIAGDGWSVGLFARELGELYGAFVQGLPSPLPEPPIQYEDFAAWQRGRLSGEALAEQVAWWRERLAGVPPLELPTDRPRPAEPSHRGAAERVAVPAELTRSLAALGAREGATLFMTLLAGFGAVLGRYAGQELFAVGSPISGRSRGETEGLIGFFVNTLVLRCDLSGDPTVRELVARVRETCLGAYAHQETPFERLVEELRPERDLSRSPLFQVMLGVQPEEAPVALPGLEAGWIESEGGTARFDLTLSLTRSGEALAGLAELATDLFDSATVRGLLRHLRVLLEAASADAGRRVSELPLMEEAERRQVLVDWNRTARPFPAGETLYSLFAAQAERTPGAVALVAGEERLAYGELRRRAEALAARLRRLGVGPEVRVGICARRSAELVAGILGVLAAGGAYVPLDPDYPAARLAFFLEDSAAPVLLTQASLVETLPPYSGRLLLLDHPETALPAPMEGMAAGPPDPPSPDNAAYVIYTSGSTGRPKGVEIEHRSAVALVRWALETFPPESLAGVLFSTSVCFDLSIFELFVPLSRGGSVVLAANALDLPELAAAGEVTLINTVPSAITELLRAGAVPPSARVVNLAGEPLRAGLVEALERLGTGVTVYNLYGPTEDTTYSTWARVAAGGAGWTPPIGRPIANTRAYLVDRRLQPVPAGVPGELLLAGDGLARGYLGRPDVTAERFIPDPFADAPGERLYRTGDLCRLRPDGQLHFLGRLDHQVKIRGFRIEPGEIEAALAAQPGMREAAVLVVQDPATGPRLVAFAEGTPASPALVDELRRALEQRLPSYMIPSAFVLLDAFPRTPNGKVDRKALPVPGAPRSERLYVAPRTPAEETLAAIWRAVLGVERIGVHDDFFQLGGHSLLGTQVISRIRDAFGIPDLPLRALFQSPTVADLALLITQQQADAVDSNEMDELLTELENLSPAELARWLQDETQGES